MIISRPTRVSPLVPLPLPSRLPRDFEVGRYDHVPVGAPWLEAIALRAASAAGVPVAAINLMKSTTQRTLAAVGMEAGLRAREDTLCSPIIDEARTVVVEDVSLDPRWVRSPFVDGRWGRVRFYGAVPLLRPGGLAVGTLCVLDEQPRSLGAAEVEVLEDLAREVVVGLERSRSAMLRAAVGRRTPGPGLPRLACRDRLGEPRSSV